MSSWQGRTREYDLVKEFVFALAFVSVLTVALAALFSSPDEPQVTLATWSTAAPADFVATAATELDGTSGTAGYGAPYNHGAVGQKLGPLTLQKSAGVTHPIDTARDFVIEPLKAVAGAADLTASLSAWDAAGSTKQQAWATAYDQALQANPTSPAPGDYGPVPVLLTSLLHLAQSGGLDGALLLQHSFYGSDYTRPLLFIADGSYLADQATAQHLAGDQWGMMNETGSFPGQPWLWLFSFWYQVPPFDTSDNADVQIFAVMGLLTAGFVGLPFLPGVRSIPRVIPIHRLIWRSYYRDGSGPTP